MPAAAPYGTYDRFAWFYAQGWGDDFHAQFRPVLDDSIAPLLDRSAHVLDLCCGSGDLSAALAARGYRVTGIDGSAEMLDFARKKAPGVEFLLEDARTFHFEPVFDAVLSTFDSLNHVLTLEELECVFRNVLAALEPGGLFVFDLNMQECFETLWRGTSASVTSDSAAITRGSYDPLERIGRAEVTIFRLEQGVWRREDVSVLEKAYSVEEITAALERTGFEEIRSSDAYELGMRTEIAIGRKIYFASKPNP